MFKRSKLLGLQEPNIYMDISLVIKTPIVRREMVEVYFIVLMAKSGDRLKFLWYLWGSHILFLAVHNRFALGNDHSLGILPLPPMDSQFVYFIQQLCTIWTIGSLLLVCTAMKLTRLMLTALQSWKASSECSFIYGESGLSEAH